MEINIGKALKEHRENAGLTVTALAKGTGISRQNLSRWEINQVVPNALACIKLAKYYDVSLDELLGLTD